ncbi:hypothetical protein NOR_07283 [Metarhizium rileyi]|uniref:BTB domain-containing protein n=1 Tax=Metarhizium rileyi (strain RCEF 4871) TaxID=1649241 RepID=A0A166YKM1_METRR|nr:hypothetical protein NOR_07283 [Metarhizium rileyi RCEF 4871]
MPGLLLDMDPQGDVLLILRPTPQELVWSPSSLVNQADHQATATIALGSVETESGRDYELEHEDEADVQSAFDPVPEAEPEAEPEPESQTEAEPAAEAWVETAPEPDEPPLHLNEHGETELAGQLFSGNGDGTAKTKLEQQAIQSFAPLEHSGDNNEVHFRLSSRHLSLASHVFNTMLCGCWKESTKKDTGLQLRYEIAATEWNTEVFLLLMNIVHGHHRQVPPSVDIDTFGEFSILVDYYKCHEITEFFAHLWADKLRCNLPTSYGRHSTIWLFVSWVFSIPDIFKKMTELAMKESQGPLETMCLPLPPTLLSKKPQGHAKKALTQNLAAIEKKRTDSLHRILRMLDELREGLIEGRKGCRYECSSMLLGTLVKEMDKNKFRPDQLLESLSNKSINQVKSTVLGFKTSVWYSDRYHDRYADRYSAPHSCSLRSMLQPAIEDIWGNLNGLRLDEYQDISVAKA